MRGCRKRTARVSVTSRERMRIISPRTPRNSGSALRAATRFAIHAKADFTAFRSQALDQRRQCDARIEMAFVREEQTFAKAPRKIRLKLGDARFVHWRMRLCPRREAIN